MDRQQESIEPQHTEEDRYYHHAEEEEEEEEVGSIISIKRSICQKKRKRICEEDEDDEEKSEGVEEQIGFNLLSNGGSDDMNDSNLSQPSSSSVSTSSTSSLPPPPSIALSPSASKSSARPKKSKLKSSSSSTLTPQAIEPDPGCVDEIASLSHMLTDERNRRSGWIPSLIQRPAASIDSNEFMIAARAELHGETSELARRRETQDTFLLNLAAKYAKPTKKSTTGERKRKTGQVAATVANKAAISTDSTDRPPSALSSNNSSSSLSSSAISSSDLARRPRPKKKKIIEPPSDMEFLMLQEKLAKEVWKKKEKQSNTNDTPAEQQSK